MTPLARSPLRLADLVAPTRIDVVARVVSPNVVTSPVSGLEAAFVQLVAFERVSADGATFALVAVILGDLVRFELGDSGVVVELPVRRAKLQVMDERDGVFPIERAAPELVPLFVSAKRAGVLCQREDRVLSGQRLRLRAIVERTLRVVTSASATTDALVVRDDLGPIMLDEVIDTTGA